MSNHHYRLYKRPGRFLAYCALVHALRHQTNLWRGEPTVLGVVIRHPEDVEIYMDALGFIAYGDISGFADMVRDDTVVLRHPDPNDKAGKKSLPELAMVEHPRIILVTSSRTLLPLGFERYADDVVDILPPDARHAKAAAKLCLTQTITNEQAAAIAETPLNVISNTLRKGRRVAKAISQMKLLAARPATSGAADSGPTLADLHGMDEATEWGHQLAADLADWRAGTLDWSQVDRGVLLSGPSGTGKTSFAAALARTCDADLVVGSIARWQACGHMGELLKAMRSAFAEAVEKAPSVLFIDEIDAIGDRQNFEANNRNYGIQVIAGLLECIDGLERRNGVVVVGAANYPDMIDPALKRPGRLDRHIKIGYPNAMGRERILRWYLRERLREVELNEVLERTDGWSGAALEKLVRDAARLARRQRRPITLGDLLASLPVLWPLPTPILHRNAVHEAGHVVVGLVLNAGVFRKVRLVKAVDPAGGNVQQLGGATFERGPDADRSLSQIKDIIAVCLAGTAAEEVIFGKRGPGSGGSAGSDLHTATLLALRLEASYGLGGGLGYLAADDEADLFAAMNRDMSLKLRVERVLAEEFVRAQRQLEHHEVSLQRIADALLNELELSAGRVAELTGSLLGPEERP